MDETRAKPPAGYVYEFGTWRLIPAGAVRQATTQGRPPKKKGG
ncbi:MAG TPA: hypothetical protein VNT75_12990 [Symbiobacteriaceae bacterium]|nr:hypothetical protein [Symbiobacteriaceae bacterium]